MWAIRNGLGPFSVETLMIIFNAMMYFVISPVEGSIDIQHYPTISSCMVYNFVTEEAEQFKTFIICGKKKRQVQTEDKTLFQIICHQDWCVLGCTWKSQFLVSFIKVHVLDCVVFRVCQGSSASDQWRSGVSGGLGFGCYLQPMHWSRTTWTCFSAVVLPSPHLPHHHPWGQI